MARGGYAWLFAIPDLRLFLFRASRLARVAREVLGEQAKRLRRQIADVTQQPVQHLGVRHIQDIFRDNHHRLYHRVENRNVPAGAS